MVERVEYYEEFLLNRQKEIQEKRKERLKQEKLKKQQKMDQVIPKEVFVYEKKITNDEIVQKGEILKVKDTTLSKDDFRVEASYQGIKIEAIASRQEIIAKNIGALLDFYEKELKLKDQPIFYS